MQQQETGNRKLYTISGNGYSAACDAFAVDPDTDQIWFASMLGTLASVRAIAAAIEDRTERNVFLNSEDYEGGYRSFIPAHPVGGWVYRSARLTRINAHHAIIYPQEAEYNHDQNRFLIVARHPDEAPILHLRFLDRRTPLPLHPSWKQWIWKRSLEKSETKKLESHGIHTYLCSPNQRSLAEDVSQAIREGRLQVLTSGR